MTLSLYLVQLSVISLFLLMLTRNKSWVLQVQVLVWTVAVAAIAIRSGLVGQVEFYSNDQRYYREVVQLLAADLWVLDVDLWLTGSKLPFTLPATLLYGIGVEPVLALKTISIVCLLSLTSDILKEVSPRGTRDVVSTLLLTACGVIGLFFSSLALRETMMMLFVTRFLLTKSPTIRVVSALILLLLRPHLAISLVLASLAVIVWRTLRRPKIHSVGTVVGLVVCGVGLGRFLYPLGNYLQFGSEDVFVYSWGISSITRIASNFIGLQFLTAPSDTVSFALTSLVMLRLLLIETVLIPALFTLFTLVRPEKLDSRRATVLFGFSIYIALVTNTDYNSFRQNIPFMPVMGLLTLELIRARLARGSKFVSEAEAHPQSATESTAFTR